VVAAAGVVLDAEGAEAPSGDGALAAALEKIGRLQAENAELRVSLAEVLARDAEREAELEKLRADLAVLQRMLFGRSSEKSRPEPPAGGGGGGDDDDDDDDDDAGGDGGRDRGRESGRNVRRGPGARAGRRDYSHLPRFEVSGDFPGGGYCCPQCGEPFSPLSDHWSAEHPARIVQPGSMAPYHGPHASPGHQPGPVWVGAMLQRAGRDRLKVASRG
jgi:hypothetical protein